jgi:hypothetical protein
MGGSEDGKTAIDLLACLRPRNTAAGCSSIIVSFMNAVYLLLPLVVSASQLGAADIGLYDISNGSPSAPLKEEIERVTISSQSNDNRHYYLALRASNSFSLPCNQIGLVVGTQTIRFNSQGTDGAGHFTSMETTIDDPEVIPQIAQYFHATVLKRRHVGHRMLVEFITDKAESSVGEPVIAKLRITNIGDTEFAFMQGGRQRGPRDNQFAFTAELFGGKMMPDIGDPQNMGGLGVSVALKAGQSHEIKVDLTKWFNFSERGTYNLRGSYRMDFLDPAARDFYTLWEDYACAEFTVRIKK